MKLLEFVPWGRRSGRPDPPSPSSSSPREAAPPESRTGMASKSRRRAAPTWKPSLAAISENTALAEVKTRSGGGSEKTRRRSTGGGGLPRTNHEDFRNFRAATMMPTFTPTSFLF